MIPKYREPTSAGEMLVEEFLKPLGLTQGAAAAKMGIPLNRLNEIINGKRGITADTALRLGELLGEPNATAAQRFALYIVCARIKNLQLIGPLSDPAGRAGTALAHTDKHEKIQHRLILEPDTSTLLASQQLTLADHQLGYPTGTQIAHTTHHQTTILDIAG